MQRVHYIAGASGVGTSTRARELQSEWAEDPEAPSCCVIATDVVRAQLRAVLDRAAHPDLWGESFTLPVRAGDAVRTGVSIDAFMRQCEPILRAVEAGVEYALTEGWDVIVEGVHLVPGSFVMPDAAGVDVSIELISVEDADEHVVRFRSRDLTSNGRRSAAHYEANLERVRAIQAELVDRWTAWQGGNAAN